MSIIDPSDKSLYIPQPNESQLISRLQAGSKDFTKRIIDQAYESDESGFTEAFEFPELDKDTPLTVVEFKPEIRETNWKTGEEETTLANRLKIDLHCPHMGDKMILGTEDPLEHTWFTDEHIINPSEIGIERPFVDSYERDEIFRAGLIKDLAEGSFNDAKHRFSSIKDVVQFHLDNFYRQVISVFPLLKALDA